MSRVLTVLSYGVVLVLAVELAVGEAFLVSARPFGTAFPVAALAAVVGNVVVGVAGARVLDRPVGAAVPGVVWLVIALAFSSRRSTGGLVVPGTGRGVAFLVAGTAAAAAVAGLSRAAKAGASPGGDSGR